MADEQFKLSTGLNSLREWHNLCIVLQDIYYVVNVPRPVRSYSKPVVEEEGEFQMVCYCDDLKENYYMYHYDETSLIRTSDATMPHFLCSVTPVDVNKIFAQAGQFQVRSRIALMHVDEHTSLVKSAVQEAEELASKNEPIPKVIASFKALMSAKVTLLKVKELSLNDFVANQIQAVAGGLGYEVETDKSRLFKTDPKRFNLSRFHTSRPDLFIYNHSFQDCYVVDDMAKLVVGTTDGDNDPGCGSIKQTNVFQRSLPNPPR